MQISKHLSKLLFDLPTLFKFLIPRIDEAVGKMGNSGFACFKESWDMCK
jgi:hypothetical protein